MIIGLIIFGLVAEFVGTTLIIRETIKGAEYIATRTEVEDYPKYYNMVYTKKGVEMIPTSFPKQWKRLILWLCTILLGILNQICGTILYINP